MRATITRISHGFTLAELLIALAILGVIATFTIPKILDSSQDSKNKALCKEVLSTVAGVYQNYKLNNTVSATTTMGDFTPYINYIATDSTSTIDAFNGRGVATTCASANCLRLATGAILYYGSNNFGSLQTTNAIPFIVDPDGKATGIYSSSNPGAICGLLYYNGKLKTFSNAEAGTAYSPSSLIGCGSDPSWFDWNS